MKQLARKPFSAKRPFHKHPFHFSNLGIHSSQSTAGDRFTSKACYHEDKVGIDNVFRVKAMDPLTGIAGEKICVELLDKGSGDV